MKLKIKFKLSSRGFAKFLALLRRAGDITIPQSLKRFQTYILRSCEPIKQQTFKFCKYCGNLLTHAGDNIHHWLCSRPECSIPNEREPESTLVYSPITDFLRKTFQDPSRRNLLFKSFEKRAQFQGKLDDFPCSPSHLKIMQYMNTPKFISVMIFVDGFSLYKSSQKSVHTIQLMINELPYAARVTNIGIIGLWQGRGKPSHQILIPLIEELKELEENGLKIEGLTENVRVILIGAITDLVARPFLQGIQQFNGKYGCTWCIQKSERVNGKQVYKFHLVPEQQRTHLAMWTSTAFLDSVPKATDDQLQGIKFRSLLFLLGHFDMARGFLFDYMHTINLGITKKILSLWFSTASAEYSLKHSKIIINQRIKLWHVPSEYSRSGRELIDFEFFKANEFDELLLLFSDVIFDKLCSSNAFLEHFQILANILFLSREEVIEQFMVKNINDLCEKFVKDAELLYGPEHLSANFHQLLHFADCINNHGPSYKYSTYPHEGTIYLLRSLFHGCEKISEQIMTNFNMLQSIENKLNEFAEGDKGKPQPIFAENSIRVYHSGVPTDELIQMALVSTFHLPDKTDIFEVESCFYKSARFTPFYGYFTRFMNCFVHNNSGTLGAITNIYFLPTEKPHIIFKVNVWRTEIRERTKFPRQTPPFARCFDILDTNMGAALWEISSITNKAAVDEELDVPKHASLLPNFLEIH